MKIAHFKKSKGNEKEFELNENKNTMCQNLWDAAKTVEIFIALKNNSYDENMNSPKSMLSASTLRNQKKKSKSNLK